MSLKRQMNNRQLLDSLDCIDERFVAELVTSMKLPENKTADPNEKKNWFRSFKYAAAVAACALLLSAIIPIMGMIVGRVEIGSSATNPAGTPTAENLETEAPETEQIIQSNDLMIKYGWSPKSITNAEADEIIEAYLANDTDPSKLAYTYSVTCYSKYSTNSSAPVYAVMINSDRWTYEAGERVEEIFYRPENPDLHIDFIFPSEQPLWIYTEGSFYTLNEAMQESLLNLTQLLNIRWSDRKGGGFSSFVYPIWLCHSELVEIVHSNPESSTGGWEFRCYGNYNGVYVIFADKKFKEYEPKETIEIVNGLAFVYPNENKLQVCANGTFYSLSDAYEKSIISAEQLAEVHSVYTMEKNVRSQFIAKYGDEFPQVVNKSERFDVFFHGIYDDVYVATIAMDCYSNVKNPTETVNGLTFTWMQQYDIHVYYKGEFYTLTEAFDKGLINGEQLEEVHGKYNTAFNEMFGDR